MRLLLVLLTTACCWALILAQSPRGLEEKVKLLQDTLMKRPVVSLNNERWKSLVRSTPRNYSMIVMFTALSSEYNCAICKAAYEEFIILANSYRYAHMNSKQVYFGMVDYEEAPQIFQSLNLNTAPVIYHFPAKNSPKKQDQMDFQRQGFGAEAIAKFVQDRTDVNIRVLRPPNYAGPVVILLLVMLILGLLYMRRDNLDFIYSTYFWGSICVIATVAFTSGQMWNHIRSPPFVMTHPHTRETSFIHGSTQYQLVAETYIVFVIYAVISLGMILLNDFVQAKVDYSKRRMMVFVGIGLFVTFCLPKQILRLPLLPSFPLGYVTPMMWNCDRML
ncbi:hypothetical protein M3Y98_00267600 [Aphelenchoides besseyi]|nr:hypothetical protein M3Y98_00267600 [Aphelenchoides besseyi]